MTVTFRNSTTYRRTTNPENLATDRGCPLSSGSDFSAERILPKLCEAEIVLTNRRAVVPVYKQIGVSVRHQFPSPLLLKLTFPAMFGPKMPHPDDELPAAKTVEDDSLEILYKKSPGIIEARR